MAAGQLPRHDFAPAWLKLPNHENSAWKQGTSDRIFYPLSVGDRSVSHHHRSNYGSRNGIGYDDFIAAPSVSQCPQFGWQRFSNSDYHDYDVTYNGAQLRSSSRQGPGGSRPHSQVNGTFSDPYLGFPGRRPVVVNGNGSSQVSRKSQRPKDSKSASGSIAAAVGKKASVSSTKAAANSTSSALDEEFPCLNGDATIAENEKITSSSSSTKVSSVWSSPNRQLKSASRSLNSDSGHRSLVLKTGSSKRLVSQSSSESQKQAAKDVNGEALTSTTVEELNACLVTHPTIVVDKKSRFLRSLRENHDSDNEQNGSLPSSPSNSPLYEEEFDKEIAAVETNGHISGRRSTAGHSPIEANLSSSYEAEERLLREMGWKGNDDDDDTYEITEADVIEFEKLCHQLKVNGLVTKKRNGIVEDGPARSASTRTLSLPGFIHDLQLPHLGDTTGSLSSDSSDDEVFGNAS